MVRLAVAEMKIYLLGGVHHLNGLQKAARYLMDMLPRGRDKLSVRVPHSTNHEKVVVIDGRVLMEGEHCVVEVARMTSWFAKLRLL